MVGTPKAKRLNMKTPLLRVLPPEAASRRGKIGWILLWLLGIPIPVLLILFLLRGCT